MSASASSAPGLDALVEALLLRLRRGESLDVEALAKEHPAHAERLRALVPVLQLVERVRTPSAPPRPPDVARPAASPGGLPAGVPARVGRWRLTRELGRGGMGRVFEAHDEAGGRAALKLVHAHLLAVPGIVERFLREAEVGRRVQHPNVVRTLDAGRAQVGGEDVPWLALEHVEGQNLRRLLDEAGSVSERLARLIGQGVADALAAVHAAGLVHRDVKPENVVITPREEVRLMDLGLALVRDSAARLSASGDFVGTLHYAAPEQLGGHAVGPAADLYALGLVLLELVGGWTPGRRAPTGPGAAARLGPQEVSPFFGALVAALLEPDPTRRLGDAAQVAALLRLGEASPWWRARAAAGGVARRIAVDASAPLVGRADELGHLEGAFAASLRGEGRVVLVEGEAGLGKSRLVHDWLERVEGAGPTGLKVALAQHMPGADDEALLPLSLALRDLLGPGELRARLAVLLDEGARLADVFAAWLEGRGPLEAPTWPEASRLTAHRLLLSGLAREGPVVLVAEDLDRASPASQRLFLALARAAAHERVLLVATSAEGLTAEVKEALRSLPHADTVNLEPLGRDDAHDLFRAALGEAPTTAPWHEAVRGAGGNPLCLVEAARAAGRGAPASSPCAVPDALRRAVEQRVAALDPASAHLLAVAACAGERFDPSLVCAAAGVGRIDGLRRLHRLDREHRLVLEQGEGYRFAHAMLRSVVQDDLPPALRAEIHGALAEAVRAAGPPPLAGARATLWVEHVLRGPHPEAALTHAEEALRHLTASNRWREGAATCEALLALPAGLPPRLEALVLAHLGGHRLLFAPTAEVVPPLERGLALAQRLGDDPLALYAALQLAAALGQAGRLEDSLAHERLAEGIAERLGTTGDRLRAAVGLAASFYDLGRLGEAAQAAERAAELARVAGDPWSLANAAYFQGVVALGEGDLARARPHLLHAGREARALGDPHLETSAITALAKADYLEGRLAGSVEHLERLIALAREQGELRSELVTRMNLATVELALGRHASAGAAARAARLAGEHAGLGWVIVQAHYLEACAEMQGGAWGLAEQRFVEAFEGATTMGNPLLAAQVSARHVVLLAWTGRFEAAEALLDAHAPAVEAESARRERLTLQEARASLALAQGRSAEAAAILEPALALGRSSGLAQEAARLALALGASRRELGHVEAARRALDEAQAAAMRMGLEGIAALARVHLATLPGAEGVPGRVALSEHGAAMGVHPRLRAAVALAEATHDPALRAAARADLELLVTSLPEARRGPMLERVALHRALVR